MWQASIVYFKCDSVDTLPIQQGQGNESSAIQFWTVILLICMDNGGLGFFRLFVLSFVVRAVIIVCSHGRVMGRTIRVCTEY